MPKSNAEEFILLLFDGQTEFTRLGASVRGQQRLYPFFNVSKSILDRTRERKRDKERERLKERNREKRESLKLAKQKELLQKK